MVNSSTTFTKLINGYDFICMADNRIYPDAIEFCPHSGKECENGFLWELQHEIYDILAKNGQDEVLVKLLNKNLLSSQFNIEDIPMKLKFLLKDKMWFYTKIDYHQSEHNDHNFCGGFSSFLDSLYSEKSLPLIAKKAIQFCPFCGIKLGETFNKNGWFANKKNNTRAIETKTGSESKDGIE